MSSQDMALLGLGCVSTALPERDVLEGVGRLICSAVLRPSTCFRILAVAGASMILVSAAMARSSVSGTWVARGLTLKGIPVCSGGRDIGCIPPSVRALYTFRLTFSGSRLQYYGEGPTEASHDPVSAKGTCRMRMAFDHVGGGWTYYVAVARATFIGEGGPGVACQTTALRWGKVTLRVRPAGAKLRLEFGEQGVASSYGDAYTYLSRAA